MHQFGWNRMPMHNFGPGIPGLQPGFNMMGRGGFGFFPFFGLLLQLAIVGLIIWLVYKVVTGWRITLTRPSQTTQNTVETEAKPTESTK